MTDSQSGLPDYSRFEKCPYCGAQGRSNVGGTDYACGTHCGTQGHIDHRSDECRYEEALKVVARGRPA